MATSMPTQEQLVAARFFEAARRPYAVRLSEQYASGLLAFWEFVCALTEVDVEITNNGAKCWCGARANWLSYTLGNTQVTCEDHVNLDSQVDYCP